jgi:hypothetical protein
MHTSHITVLSNQVYKSFAKVCPFKTFRVSYKCEVENGLMAHRGGRKTNHACVDDQAFIAYMRVKQPHIFSAMNASNRRYDQQYLDNLKCGWGCVVTQLYEADFDHYDGGTDPLPVKFRNPDL